MGSSAGGSELAALWRFSSKMTAYRLCSSGGRFACSRHSIGIGSDSRGVFKLIEEDGEPVLPINGQLYASHSTKGEFENSHRKMEFKWGDKKCQPRDQTLRDSGNLCRCTGDHGAIWNVLLNSLESHV